MLPCEGTKASPTNSLSAPSEQIQQGQAMNSEQMLSGVKQGAIELP